MVWLLGVQRRVGRVGCGGRAVEWMVSRGDGVGECRGGLDVKVFGWE